jgi:hypothetical protein
MQIRHLLPLLLALPSAVMAQTSVFSDNFSASTLNSATPTAPTATSTSYELSSAKTWSPAPSIASGDLKFGIAASSSGVIEVQGLFASSPITLGSAGDYIRMSVTFVNTSGLLTQNSILGFGMYNASGVAPIAGGLNGTAISTSTGAATGGAQNWQGYVAQIGYTGLNSGFFDRQAQTGANNNNQELVTSGSSSSSYRNPSAAAVGTTSTTPSATLTAGSTYTEILTYTLTGTGALKLDSNLYSGTDNTGTLLSTLTATTSGTPLTTTFDGLAIGWRSTIATTATTMDINQISVMDSIAAIPEPSTLALTGLGAAALLLVRRRRVG